MVLYLSENLTSIQLSKAVKEQLKKLGKEGETYDDIIRRLIRIAESHTQRESQTNTPEVSETREEAKRVAEIENILKDIHKKFRGKFQDWKEKDHEADELLFRLVREEEQHENH